MITLERVALHLVFLAALYGPLAQVFPYTFGVPPAWRRRVDILSWVALLLLAARAAVLALR